MLLVLGGGAASVPALETIMRSSANAPLERLPQTLSNKTALLIMPSWLEQIAPDAPPQDLSRLRAFADVGFPEVVKMRTAAIVPLMAGAIMLVTVGAAFGLSALGIRTAIHNCQNSGIAPEMRIEACTEVIRTNLASHAFLARFYYNRAVGYESANDVDRARQDYDKALELKPDFAEARANRARLDQHPATPAAAAP